MNTRLLVAVGLAMTLVCLLAVRPTWACEDSDPANDSEETPTESTPDDSEDNTVSPVTSARFNEFLPAPATGEEFIEIEILDEGGGYLDGWSVQDASGKVFTFNQEEIETRADRFFVLTDTISKISLNNTGDTVDLISPEGVVMDHQEFAAADKDMSWSRFESGWEWATATAGAENVELADEEEVGDDDGATDSDDAGELIPEDDAGDVSVITDFKINELLPNPEGDESTDEWIELVNEGETGTPAGWTLTDGKSTYEFEDAELGTDDFLVVSIEDSGVTLNNTGDVLYLISPEDEIVQGVEYGDAPSGESFSRFEEVWEWTTSLTPGEENVANAVEEDGSVSGEGESSESEDADEASDVLTLAEAKTLEKGAAATVQGVVEVEPGPLGDQIIYIQDDTAGMQIYSYDKDFPVDTVRGALVSVTGVMSSAYAEVRINADDGGVSVVAQQDEVLPKAVEELAVDDIGMLVLVSGEVDSKTSTRLTLTSGIEVYVKSSTDISLSGISVGNQVQVVGIVNQYNETLRVLPREQGDIQVTQTVADDLSGAGASTAQAGSFGAGESGSSQGRKGETWTIQGGKNQAPGWLILGLAGGVVTIGLIRQWWKKKQIAKRMFPAYSTPHEDQRGSDSRRGVPAQLPPGTGT